MEQLWLRFVGLFGAVFLFGFAVFVHELGHFLAAKMFGVGVKKFAIGFGPKIFGIQRGETEYSVRWIPLGGFVALKGMLDDEEEEQGQAQEGEAPSTEETEERESAADEGAEKKGSITEDLDALRNQHPLKRIVVFASGVTCNFITAILLVGLIRWYGLPVYEPLPTRIDDLSESSIMYQLGWREGDRVVAVAGQAVDDFQGLNEALAKARGEEATTVTMTVARGDRRLELPFPPDVPGDQLPSFEKPPRIEVIMPASPAHRARLVERDPDIDRLPQTVPAWSEMPRRPLQSGDRVLAINAQPIETWQQMREALQAHPEESIYLTVRSRKGETLRLQTVLERSAENPEHGHLGVQWGPVETGEREGMPFFEAFLGAPAATVQRAVTIVALTVEFIATSPWRQTRRNLGGPMAIGVLAYQNAQRGLVHYLNVFAMISIILAVMNILPIPVLDGGYIFITLIEIVIRRPVPERVLKPVLTTFMVMFLMLFALLFYNDFMNWIVRM